MILQKIHELRDSIKKTASGVGRDPDEISFLLVTKTVPAERVREALEAGVTDFGENRVQELLSKKKELGASANWHMIGHLQTNKVKSLLQNAGAGAPLLIHSLDRLDLAQAINRQAKTRVACLIQVNASGEETKFGLKPEEVESFVRSLAPFESIEVQGLMTIGPPTKEEDKIRAAFRRVKILQQELIKKFPERSWGTLSMGMSGDYRIAIEEEATLLRIGTAVFGNRR